MGVSRCISARVLDELSRALGFNVPNAQTARTADRAAVRSIKSDWDPNLI
ncbi:hypothetical protein FOXG_22252 [Fusarium oxysporum f. sp. lycopersici 4287]|uniref:Uncharacterized protein n=2 Tax=Fusarium oxysporum TaxID=5507 RepID=A0A0J9W6S5_FUSO4|nr:hypothetical protein FOXG_22252 [Fusarium oxysporum f. sp. lycopersici 4287]EXK26734.1 hypothetical protein FOMG_16680 [Fusarium oxysporum f. sp. melonis 26406]KNB18475.1 hypothetical protein FOXG_22252 [Fusarium oxysporum f. sp. lycopersici 4287]